MLRKKLCTILIVIIGITAWVLPVNAVQLAQLPFIQDIAIYSRLLRQVQDNSLNSACIRLDGRCLFKLSATDPELLSDRIGEIQKRFAQVSADYLAVPNSQSDVTVKANGNLQDLYITIGDRSERLFTVTTIDAEANDVGVPVRTRQLEFAIEQGLETARKERSPQHIRRQIVIGLCILLCVWLINFPLDRKVRVLRRSARKLAPTAKLKNLPISDQLDQRQKWNLTEIQYRLMQLVQVFLWSGGALGILNLYPQTRIIPFLLIAALRIPLRITLVGLLTYFVIRLTYFLIAKLSAAAIDTQSRDLKVNQRGKLRINTTTRILRSAVTIIWVGIGVLTAFWINGVNLAPLLTGAGIFGLALSLASQNLIKDAINGFIIIWDDRYAVGDVVDIGAVGGLVENINLRITQLRDAEGRLITIPNSAVEIVSNRSSQWSRADLVIPVAYQTDIDRALEVIHQVAQAIAEDCQWRDRIWEFPTVLGVDQFSERGILIRVWIITEPLQQWDVAREFRRRIKIAFDQAGIPIPVPQQQILFDQQKVLNKINNIDQN
ncbi:MAG: mechanosensitive ion channel family protein [Pleurocapsa minor HA4230-MV1]|nr:mechanosensitive ion channel family protein [Pleurocapsa minor HA4230-MV1]